MSHKSFISLRRRFTLVFVLVFVVVGALAWFGFAQLTQVMVNHLSVQYVEKQALYDNVKIRLPILRELALARQLASSPSVLRWLANETDPELRTNALTELDAFRQSLQDHSWFVAVDSSHNYYYNDRNNTYADKMPLTQLSQDNPNDNWYFESLRQIEHYALNVDHDDNTQVTKIWLNVIVKHKGEKIGIAGTGLDLSEFLKQHVQNRPADADIVLIDAKGATQVQRDPRTIVLNALAQNPQAAMTYDRYFESEKDRAAVRAAMQDLQVGTKEVATLFVTRAGSAQLIGMVYMPEIKWFNLTVHDVGALQRQWQLLPLLGLTVLMPLLVVLLLAWFLNRLVLAPVATLADSAKRLATGDYNFSLPIIRHDELGALTQNFNTMASAMRSATTELERKVEQRTAQLRHTNAELETFNYTVSHDLRAPLRHISGFLVALRDELGAQIPATAETLLQRIEQASARMNRLIVGLLSLSRLDHASLNWQDVDLDAVLSDVCSELDDGRVRFQLSELGTIGGDAVLLRQVFANLLGNAVKYSSGQPAPVVSVALAPQFARVGETVFVVSDNGVGFDPQYSDKLFKVFQRLHSEKEFSGEGIGLATVAKIVHLHGGRIWAESGIDGTPGAKFYVALPAQEPDALEPEKK